MALLFETIMVVVVVVADIDDTHQNPIQAVKDRQNPTLTNTSWTDIIGEKLTWSPKFRPSMVTLKFPRVGPFESSSAVIFGAWYENAVVISPRSRSTVTIKEPHTPWLMTSGCVSYGRSHFVVEAPSVHESKQAAAIHAALPLTPTIPLQGGALIPFGARQVSDDCEVQEVSKQADPANRSCGSVSQVPKLLPNTVTVPSEFALRETGRTADILGDA